MNFNYDIYYRSDCIVRIGMVLFAAFVLGSAIVQNIKDKPRTFNDICAVVLMLAIFLFVACPMAAPLLRGGIYLLTEKEDDKVTICGKLEEIDDLDIVLGYTRWHTAQYSYDGHSFFGNKIIVNGTRYYLMTIGDFSLGEEVEMSVLPKSHLVLSIERTQ